MNVVVADTGLGNVRSVVRALEKASSRVAAYGPSRATRTRSRAPTRSSSPDKARFAIARRALERDGLGEAIKASIARGTNYLGICLGMQALFATSEEAPGCASALAIFPGTRREAPRRIRV